MHLNMISDYTFKTCTPERGVSLSHLCFVFLVVRTHLSWLLTTISKELSSYLYGNEYTNHNESTKQDTKVLYTKHDIQVLQTHFDIAESMNIAKPCDEFHTKMW